MSCYALLPCSFPPTISTHDNSLYSPLSILSAADSGILWISALERTFLAYIRTSNALASLAVAIYQLSRMSSPAKSTQPSTPRVLNLEKASTLFMMVGALVITVVGCSRFLVGQKRVEHGKCRTGGIDLGGVGGWMFVVSFND